MSPDRRAQLPGQMQRDLPHRHAPDDADDVEPPTLRPGEEEGEQSERIDEESDVHEHDDAAVEIAPDERGEPDSRA